MKTATFNNAVLAESDETIIVEGNHYFPSASVNWDHFSKTDRSTHCPWKGDATYYDVQANGASESNVAWQYEAPFEKATEIKDYVAFYPAVSVS